jgi:hypothetical protein
MSANAGVANQRLRPRLEVLKGWRPDTPHEMRTLYPVASGTTVKSGQVVAPKYNVALGQVEWVIPAAADGHAPDYHIAANDSDDFDVLEAGKLPALSCAGQFELETSYFTGSEETFALGTQLSVDVTGGAGNVKVAAAGEPVIGVVTRRNGVRNAAELNSNVVQSLYDADTQTYSSNPGKFVITLRTTYIPTPVS